MMKPIFIAGPCVIESAELLDTVAQELVRIKRLTGAEVYFKASFDKANRTSVDAYRGPGLAKGLEILTKAKKMTGLPLVVDVHEPWQEIGRAHV